MLGFSTQPTVLQYNMAKSIIIREAVPDEANYMSGLAMRSKQYWGYSDKFMDACIEELSVSRAYIENTDYCYVVAVIDEDIVGFYMLEGLSGTEIELGALFVDPDHIGTGVGRALLDNAKCHAKKLGAHKLNIQGDPNAEKFYRAAGGVPTGRKESESIPGRFLPTFQILLSDKNVV